jgi:hypothetical protein
LSYRGVKESDKPGLPRPIVADENSRPARSCPSKFGMVGSAVTGTAGTVITLRIDQHLAGIALAELVLALVIAMLIAAHGRRADQAHE